MSKKELEQIAKSVDSDFELASDEESIRYNGHGNRNRGIVVNLEKEPYILGEGYYKNSNYSKEQLIEALNNNPKHYFEMVKECFNKESKSASSGKKITPQDVKKPADSPNKLYRYFFANSELVKDNLGNISRTLTTTKDENCKNKESVNSFFWSIKGKNPIETLKTIFFNSSAVLKH